MIEKYNPREIEQKWQKIWEEEKLYAGKREQPPNRNGMP